MFKTETIEKRIDELLDKMTLEEKIGQLYQSGISPVGGFEISIQEAEQLLEAGRIGHKEYERLVNAASFDEREDMIRKGTVGSFIGVQNPEHANHLQRIAVEESRLGIPLIFGLDVVHGHRTVFPSPIAEACTFNDELFEKSAEIAAREASEDGINWTFAPMVDVSRDPRWGRVVEGPGEDTYLASRFAAAKVRGFQGDDLSAEDRICACVKHFAAYGACEGGRDYNTVDMSEAKLREVYLPPFAAAVKAGAATLMPAFNDINGSPCTTNKWLLNDYLRDELGFDGFLISDAHGIQECVFHGTAETPADAAEQAIKAGCDMDMGCEYYTDCLPQLLEEGRVSMDEIDRAVRNILRIKMACGLFEHPYVQKPEKSSKLCAEHRDVARDIADRSIVLLKNNGVLPLKADQKVLVVGYFGDKRKEMLGAWVVSGREEDAISLTDALKEENIDFDFVPCIDSSITSMTLDKEQLEDALRNTKADTVIALVGESSFTTGEAQSKSKLELIGGQTEMLRMIKTAGKKLVTLLINGRPLAIPQEAEMSDAMVECWQLGVEAGHAMYDVIYGKYNPSGRLSMTFPQNSGSCPMYYNHMNTGRPASDGPWTSKYTDCPYTPVFPFGWGLSYTEYDYSNLTVKAECDKLVISADITNIGNMEGEETVQVYIHRRRASHTRPVRELKAYKKVYLQPGETEKVTVELSRNELGYYNNEPRYITEESMFDIFVAHDSTGGLHSEICF